MSSYAYLFEARSIQQFILDTSRLADMVGASQLVDDLCNTPLDKVLATLGLEEGNSIRFSRRAGGAFVALLQNRDMATRLRDTWGLVVSKKVPGLEFVHVLCEGHDDATAAGKGYRQLAQERNRPRIRLPEAGPLVRRSPRTGIPALENVHGKDGSREWVDEPTACKRSFTSASDLGEKIIPGVRWPKNFEEDARQADRFPFSGEHRVVGVVHADGNGMAQVLQRLQLKVSNRPQDYQAIYRGFSEALAKAMSSAVKEATEAILLPQADPDTKVMPARPLVLGGDDLSIIVRADLAILFTREFLTKWEQATKDVLGELNNIHALDMPELGNGMTASAGIAFVRANQPFYLAYRLAEELCGEAKKASRKAAGPDELLKPASIAFYRVTTSLVDDVSSLRVNTQTIVGRDSSLRVGYDAYGLGHPGLPHLDALLELKKLLGDTAMSHGSGRSLLMLLSQSPTDAAAAYRRWKRNIQDTEQKNPESSLFQRFKSTLSRFAIDAEGDLPFTANVDGIRHSPLGDALAWLAAEGRNLGDK